MALLGGRHLPVCLVNPAVLVAVAWFAATGSAYAQKPGFNERDVKAVFLFNFAQFAEWPPEAFSTCDPPS